MLAKVRSAANWLLPLKIQAFPGDFGELSHNMNLTKSARFQEAQSSTRRFFSWSIPPLLRFTSKPGRFRRAGYSSLEGWWFNLHLPGVDSSVSNGSIRKIFPESLRPPLEDVKSSVQKAWESCWVNNLILNATRGWIYRQRPLWYRKTPGNFSTI